MQRTYKSLIEEAKKVSQNAYAPYSKFQVGACALFESGNTYAGCNVENGSYGLSLCAERNALSNAVAAGEKTKLIAIAIYAPSQPKCTPCGACRQWIYEFSNQAQVILENENQELEIYSIEELLPKGFLL
jgi:cytidine deaminase